MAGGTEKVNAEICKYLEEQGFKKTLKRFRKEAGLKTIKKETYGLASALKYFKKKVSRNKKKDSTIAGFPQDTRTSVASQSARQLHPEPNQATDNSNSQFKPTDESARETGGSKLERINVSKYSSVLGENVAPTNREWAQSRDDRYLLKARGKEFKKVMQKKKRNAWNSCGRIKDTEINSVQLCSD